MQDTGQSSLSRRQSLVAGAALASIGLEGATSSGCDVSAATSGAGSSASQPSQGRPDPTPGASGAGPSASGRLPTIFLPHGGGPWPFMSPSIGSPVELAALRAYLEGLPKVAEQARALVVVSAHWEQPVPTVMTHAQPPLFFDYYGFPAETYALSWPAPGDPALGARVRACLSQAGIASAEDPARGFDHGTFVPLKLMYPEARLPTIQLSLKTGLSPLEHLAIGRALQPLRDEGVLLIGSGMTYHNLRAFGPHAAPVADTFDAWLRGAATSDPDVREQRLARWQEAPAARQAHPREEHLLPLMVMAGAAGRDVGRVTYQGTVLGLRLSAYQFG